MSWVIFDPSHHYLCGAETRLIGPAIYCSYEHLSSRVLLTLGLFQERRCLSTVLEWSVWGVVPVLSSIKEYSSQNVHDIAKLYWA